MLGWTNRSVECGGGVLFRGSMPPRLENFAQQFHAAGVTVRPGKAGDGAAWSAELEHPSWGSATAICLREHMPVPMALVGLDPRLSDEDRQAAVNAGSAVWVTMRGTRRGILRDRKLMLRYLRCMIGDDGVMAMDRTAMKFWTPEALDEELAHDADLDVDSLYVVHLIHDDSGEGAAEDEEPRAYWAHTHGLAELGAVDFDIIRPAALLAGGGFDLFRAVAFMLLEGKASAGSGAQVLVPPGGRVSFVDVVEFNRLGPSEDVELRGGPDDPAHNAKRVVLCDPRPRGLGRWFRRAIRPSTLLSTLNDENMTVLFTEAATDLMAERARRTFDVFRRLAGEFAEFGVKPLVKIGYPVDGARDGAREHLWFEVNRFGRDDVEATLLNQPHDIAAMKVGDRGRHSLEGMTDWTILTPAGSITPRHMMAARLIRAHAGDLRRIMREETAKGGGA